MLSAYVDDVVLSLTGNGYVRNVKGLCIHVAINGAREQLPKARNIDISRIQDRLCEIGSGPVVVVMLSGDVGRPQEANWEHNP